MLSYKFSDEDVKNIPEISVHDENVLYQKINMIISKFNKTALDIEHQYTNREMFNMTEKIVKEDYLRV